MSSVPNQPALLYASDENILSHAGGDYLTLCPAYQSMASGADGVFAPNSPWVLTSASVNFEANGVHPNQVVWLTTPKSYFPGGGHAMAVDSTSGNSITLRRLYQKLNVGQPPAPAAGITAVNFSIVSFDAQIADATYDLNQRYAIDPNQMVGQFRAPTWVYDLQVLRDATVFWVLSARYAQESRTDRGDFKDKIQNFRQRLDDAIGRIQVRWGPTGTSAEATTLFSCKISR